MNARRFALFASVLVGPMLVGLVPAASRPSVLELVQTIGLKGKPGRLDHMALDRKHDRLLVANLSNGTLDVVDLKAGRLLKQIRGQSGIQGVAYAADLDRVFVGLGSGGLCNVFDGPNYRPLKTIKFADDADNVRYDAARGQVFVAHAEKALGAIDAKTFAVKGDIQLPGQAESFQIESSRPRLYLVMPSPSQLLRIDPVKREIVATYPVTMAGGGHPLALDEANKRIFVGCRRPPMVVVMDAETGKEIVGVKIPGDVDDLFYDAKRKQLYASCGEGFLAVIRQDGPDRYEVTERLPTVKLARTSFFDAATGRLYLGVPRQPGQPGPEVRVYKVLD